MDQAEKARENRARRAAGRQGKTLRRSARRDPRAQDFGVYSLDGQVIGDLDAVERVLYWPLPDGQGN